MNRDERSLACVLLPPSLSRDQGAVPGCRDPPGSGWARAAWATLPAGEGTRVFLPRCSGWAGVAAISPPPLPGAGLQGRGLSGVRTLGNPEGKGERLSVAGGVAPPAPQSAVSLLAGLGPGRRCGEDMIVFGFA